VFGACDRRGTSLADSGLPPKRNSAQLLADIERTLYVPQSAEMKADVEVDSPDLSIRLNGIFRVRADSAFWFTFRKFGFEGARGLVTRDSVVFVNRLQREALQASTADLPEEARDLPIEPTLANLMAAFGGQPIGAWSGASVERLPGRYAMTLPAADGARMELSAGKNTRPLRWSYQDGERYGEVIFSDFREIEEGKVFPFGRSLTFSDLPGDTTRVALQLTSLNVRNDLQFPISVPKGYADMGS